MPFFTTALLAWLCIGHTQTLQSYFFRKCHGRYSHFDICTHFGLVLLPHYGLPGCATARSLTIVLHRLCNVVQFVMSVLQRVHKMAGKCSDNAQIMCNLVVVITYVECIPQSQMDMQWHNALQHILALNGQNSWRRFISNLWFKFSPTPWTKISVSCPCAQSLLELSLCPRWIAFILHLF